MQTMEEPPEAGITYIHADAISLLHRRQARDRLR